MARLLNRSCIMILKSVGHREVVIAFGKESLHEAAKKMRERHVGDVVVVKRNRSGKLLPIGMLTDRDIVVATLALDVSPEALAIEDVMTPAPIAARETDGLGKVLKLMKENGIRRVPLVGRGGELQGIVTIEDIMRFMARELSDLAETFSRERAVENRRRLKLA